MKPPRLGVKWHAFWLTFNLGFVVFDIALGVHYALSGEPLYVVYFFAMALAMWWFASKEYEGLMRARLMARLYRAAVALGLDKKHPHDITESDAQRILEKARRR